VLFGGRKNEKYIKIVNILLETSFLTIVFVKNIRAYYVMHLKLHIANSFKCLNSWYLTTRRDSNLCTVLRLLCQANIDVFFDWNNSYSIGWKCINKYLRLYNMYVGRSPDQEVVTFDWLGKIWENIWSVKKCPCLHKLEHKLYLTVMKIHFYEKSHFWMIESQTSLVLLWFIKRSRIHPRCLVTKWTFAEHLLANILILKF
jgi:hypothetical protein